jgi:hypothetical protein
MRSEAACGRRHSPAHALAARAAAVMRGSRDVTAQAPLRVCCAPRRRRVCRHELVHTTRNEPSRVRERAAAGARRRQCRLPEAAPRGWMSEAGAQTTGACAGPRQEQQARRQASSARCRASRAISPLGKDLAALKGKDTRCGRPRSRPCRGSRTCEVERAGPPSALKGRCRRRKCPPAVSQRFHASDHRTSGALWALSALQGAAAAALR